MTTRENQIEKTIVIKAPRKRVWKAISDSKEFGKWFGASIEDSFKPGTRAHGKITTRGHENLDMEMMIDRLEPEKSISWRWHPAAVDPSVDYSGEPTTLVQVTLEDQGENTKLSVRETGFEGLPASRRDAALRMNDEGWATQIKNIDRYMASSR